MSGKVEAGKVEKVWMETTVDYSYVKTGCSDVRHGECGEVTVSGSKIIDSLAVRDASSDLAEAVRVHLERVREFTQGKSMGSPRSVSSVRTKVCAEVDNGRTILGISVSDTECQPLTAGNVIPEEATVAALFRGAELTVAVLGPVGSETVTPKQETPATEPVKSGTQATPGSLPTIDPMYLCKPGRKC